ncbi:MAG: ABC transporter transmembrane domain-containing protein [Peptococcus niger]
MNTKRLLQAVSGTRRYIAISVIMQVVALVVNIFMIFVIADFAQALLDANFQLAPVCMAIGAALLLRLICQYLQTWANYRSSIAVKQRLRIALFDKAYAYGVSYSRYISPAELVQIGVEGVEQLDNYYGRFLPQLVYALLAPIILFGFLVRLNFVVALVLVAFIPIIPLAIVLVQKLAKRVMNSYWGSFIGLAERFLDNVQGLVTLKVYGADEGRNEAMNREAEAFRVATMRVLGMQLSNIAVMDVVAYGGAALGTFAAIVAFSRGDLSVSGCLAFMLLSAEFFLPLRQLGSFFHVAMNGLSAVDRLFSVLCRLHLSGS